MNVLDLVRALLDETVGTRGSVRNCRTELARRVAAEREVERLCGRISPAVDAGDAQRTSA